MPPKIGALNATLIDPDLIVETLNSGVNFTVSTNGDGNQAGNIWLFSPLFASVNGSATLTFEAANDITLNAPIQVDAFLGPLGVTLSAGGQLTANAEIVTQGGNVSLAAGGDITVNSAIATRDVLGGKAGDIEIVSGASIRTGGLFASQVGTQLGGSGGNVSLKANGPIQAETIDTRALGSGNGESVEIGTGDRVQVTGTFRDGNTNLEVSIVTTGPNGDGRVLIKHGGGSLGFPFVVGNGTLNGTAGAIAAGTQSLGDVLRPVRTFAGNFTAPSGKIAIRTNGSALSPDNLSTCKFFGDEMNREGTPR